MKITKKTRVFMTGTGGMLGAAAIDILSKKCTLKFTSKTPNEKGMVKLDVRDIASVKKEIQKFKPHIVFHLAALTDLEYCETNAEDSWDTNAHATENIAYLCKELKIPMVYICTAGIYDGKKEFYYDYDIPNPISEYGKSKYAGELAVQRILHEHFIFRAGWMMGGGPKKDKKFVGKIMRQIEGGAKTLYVVDDKLGTPTYTYDLIENAIKVIEHDAYGLYNLICEGSCSRYDVAKEILRILGNKKIKLKKVKSAHFKKDYFAPRPASEKLIPFKLKKKALYTMRTWQSGLEEYLKKQWLKK